MAIQFSSKYCCLVRLPLFEKVIYFLAISVFSIHWSLYIDQTQSKLRLKLMDMTMNKE